MTTSAFISKWGTTNFPSDGQRNITGAKMREFKDDIVAVIEDYVEANITGIQWKTAVACATTANIALTGEQTLDGFLTSASRVLVKNQSIQSQNGIYVSAAGAWTRATDADSGSELNNAVVVVSAGTIHSGDTFRQSTVLPSVGSDNIVWTNFGAAVQNLLSVLTTGNSAGGLSITDLADPTNAQDAATKAYVDAQSSGINDTDIKYYEQNDWIVGSGLGSGDHGWVVSGQGTDNTNNSYGVNTTENAFGVVGLFTSTSSSGSSFLSRGGQPASGSLLFGAHSIVYRNRMAFSVISDGTETFTALNGFAEGALVSAASSNAAYFRYTHSVNGGRWQAVTANGGSETATDTGVSADTQYHIFEIRVNQAGTSVTFYIDGSLVATNATNIPTTNVYLKFGIIKSAGTTARHLYSDWYDLLITRSTAR